MQAIAAFLTKIIDFFYEILCHVHPKVGKICSRQFFRYGACGGGNMVFDWVLFFLFYHLLLDYFGTIIYIEPTTLYALIFKLSNFQISKLIAITPHIMAFCLTFPITLLTGFWLNKYITFTQSSIRGWNQLGRYCVIVLINLIVNYVGLKFFVEICQLYPTPSKMLVTLITVAISYFGQKYYSFKK